MNEKLNKQEARQGASGKGVVIVLGVSLFLALIAAIGVYIYGEQTDNDPPLAEQIENME